MRLGRVAAMLVLWGAQPAAGHAFGQAAMETKEPAAPQAEPQTTQIAEPPLIPRQLLFADRDKSAIQLSPSGKNLGWIDLAADEQPLTILDLARPTGPTSTALVNVLAWRWTYRAEELVAITPAPEGQELRRLRLGTQANVLLTASSITIVATGRDVPGAIALSVRGLRDVPDGFVTLDLETGAVTPLTELEGYAVPFFDARLRSVAAQRLTDTTAVVDRRTSDGKWAPFLTVDEIDQTAAGVVSVSRDGTRVTFTSNETTDTTQLMEIDLRTSERRVLVHDPVADILRFGATIDPNDGSVQSAVSYRLHLFRHVLAAPVRAHFELLEAAYRGDVSVTGQSADNDTWLVRYLDGGPARYFAYTLSTKALTPLFTEIPGLAGAVLARRHAMEVTTRDGLLLRTDVYLPPGTDRDEDGVPDHPLPAVLYVHGGPWVGFEWNLWEVNRHFQLLANRGYAVIRTSFRGEPGHGKEFVDRGDRQWGGAMMNDLADIATQAVRRGIADPARTAIFGWSFGGFATALSLAQSPDQFRCGLALYGVYDLPTFLETPILLDSDLWRQRVGDVRNLEERMRLAAESPLTLARSITHPILITHGVQDDRVPASQSEQLAAALANRGQATLMMFADEGHDYMAPETWAAFWSVAERFLAQHLGGRYERAGDELSAVNVDVPSGAEHIAGLVERLAARDGGN